MAKTDWLSRRLLWLVNYKPLVRDPSSADSAHWLLALVEQCWLLQLDEQLAVVLLTPGLDGAAADRANAVQQSVELQPVPILRGELSAVVLELYLAITETHHTHWKEMLWTKDKVYMLSLNDARTQLEQIKCTSKLSHLLTCSLTMYRYLLTH